MKTIAVSLCLVVVASTPVWAGPGVLQLVKDTEQTNAALLAKLPGLQAVEDVVKKDCASKLTDQSKAQAFCECGAAVTMAVWRTGGDPKMIPRLMAYLSNPSPEGAAEFVKYQGPELYKPLCSSAGL